MSGIICYHIQPTVLCAWNHFGALKGNVYMCANPLQSCPTLCDPVDYNPPAPPSMGFSRQEHWSGSPCAPPGDLLKPRDQTHVSMSPALAGRCFTTNATWETLKGDVPRCSVGSDSLWPPWTVAHQLLCPRDSPGKNTGVGCHFLIL